jgi:hypothetical protein
VSWTYNDDAGGPVAHLDGVFRQGNAPRFHGMLRSLAEPGKRTPSPRYIEPNNSGWEDGEYRTGQTPVGYGVSYSYYSILQGSVREDGKEDLTVEQFFYHADILSGQDVGTVPDHANVIRESLKVVSGGWVERAVDRIESARTGRSHRLWVQLVENFAKDGGYLWDFWKDEASKGAMDRFSALHLWYGDRDPDDVYRSRGLGQLTQCLLGFAAVIHGARLDIDNLMGACVRNIHAWDREQEPMSEVGWALLSGIVSVATAGSALASGIAAVSTLNSIANDTKDRKELQVGSTCYDILANFLHEADDVLRKAVAGVDALVNEMHMIRNEFRYPPVPRWPVG